MSINLNVSEIIREAIVQENHDFSKVISDVANGCKLAGFFGDPNWKNVLEQCFERRRIGLTNKEIQIYTSVISDSSYEAAFVGGMAAVGVSTPLVAGSTSRVRSRSSTLIDGGPPRDMTKRFKSARSSVEDEELNKMLDGIRNADWTESVPKANAKQVMVKCASPFEKSEQMIQTVQKTAANVTQIESSARITTRRNAIYKPDVKRPSTKPATVSVSVKKALVPQVSVQVASVPQATVQKATVHEVAKVAKTAVTTNTKSSDVVEKSSVPDNAVLTNITNRITTRRQTQLLAACSGINIAERRQSNLVQRSSVLFTMVDVLKYKDVLDKFNVFVADTNEKYDYLVAEKICRSAKFLSAVVSGKPIVSLDWIQALKISSDWLNPLNYLLKDETGEKHYNFNLSDTLKLATQTNKKLFEKYSILVTPNAEIGPGALKGVIFSGGGKFLKTTLVPRKGDAVICVSHIADKNMWPTLERKYPALQKIITTNGLSSMIFGHSHDVSDMHVLHQR